MVDTPMTTTIIFSHLDLSRIDLPKLNSSILREIVTIPVGKVDVCFNFRFDIGICNLKREFAEIFLFSLFDASIVTQILERVCTVKLYF